MDENLLRVEGASHTNVIPEVQVAALHVNKITQFLTIPFGFLARESMGIASMQV